MKKNKQILIITERFHPEDFGINDLAKAWRRKGFQVTVLTQAPSYPFDRVFPGYRNRLFSKEVWDGITIYRVFSLLGYKKGVLLKVMNYIAFAVFASVASFFLGPKCEKVFVYHVGPLSQAAPAVFIKKIFNKKIYVWTLDIWPDSVFAYGFKKNPIGVKLLDWFVALVYQNCEAIFVSCQGFKAKIEKYVPGGDILFSPQWVPDAMDFDQVSPVKHLHRGFNFTFAGNIGKVQNLENVIRAGAMAASKDNSIHINIVGDGSNLDNLKEIVKKESLQNIHFWGRRPIEEMPGWFDASDVLVISLSDEPIFSLTVPAKFQAYLASGKPIYCIVKGEVAGLIDENGIGLTADPNDPENICAGFIQFSRLKEHDFEFMGNRMRKLLHEEYERDRIIDQMTQKMFCSV